MANRYFTAVVQSLEKLPVEIYAKVSFGATGAPTLSAVNSKGIISVTRNGTGLYTFVFGTASTGMPNRLDTYYKLLNISHVFDTSGTVAAPAAPQLYITNNQITNSSSASIQVQFAIGGVATDPASGEIVYIRFQLSNSSAV